MPPVSAGVVFDGGLGFGRSVSVRPLSIHNTSTTHHHDPPGVGSDPREDRYFSIPKQGQTYDAEAKYIKHWCPELAAVPADVLLNPSRFDGPARQRFGVADDAYPRPVVPLKFGGAPGGGGKKGVGYSGGGRSGGGGGARSGSSGGGGGASGSGRRQQPFKGPRRPQHRLQSAAWDMEG